jgi:hypothetical protein
LYENEEQIVLLSGVPSKWFVGSKAIDVHNLPTHFGPCSFTYTPDEKGARLTLHGEAVPPDTFLLRLPSSIRANALVNGKQIASSGNNDFVLSSGTKSLRIVFGDKDGK